MPWAVGQGPGSISGTGRQEPVPLRGRGGKWLPGPSTGFQEGQELVFQAEGPVVAKAKGKCSPSQELRAQKREVRLEGPAEVGLGGGFILCWVGKPAAG